MFKFDNTNYLAYKEIPDDKWVILSKIKSVNLRYNKKR